LLLLEEREEDESEQRARSLKYSAASPAAAASGEIPPPTSASLRRIDCPAVSTSALNAPRRPELLTRPHSMQHPPAPIYEPATLGDATSLRYTALSFVRINSIQFNN